LMYIQAMYEAGIDLTVPHSVTNLIPLEYAQLYSCFKIQEFIKSIRAEIQVFDVMPRNNDYVYENRLERPLYLYIYDDYDMKHARDTKFIFDILSVVSPLVLYGSGN